MICVFPILFTSGCNEVSRVAKSEINGISCNSEKTQDLFSELFKSKLSNDLNTFLIEIKNDKKDNKEVVEKLETIYHNFVNQHRVKLKMIRTVDSQLLESEKQCSAEIVIQYPEKMDLINKLPYLESKESDGQNLSFRELLEKEAFHVDAKNHTASKNISYKIIIADNGKDMEIEFDSDVEKLVKLSTLYITLWTVSKLDPQMQMLLGLFPNQ